MELLPRQRWYNGLTTAMVSSILRELPTDSVWSVSYKTERIVLGGWESVNLIHLLTSQPRTPYSDHNTKKTLHGFGRTACNRE